MWHEARKREKATQKLFNDYKKRAEKRREEDKVNPNSLLQIHGLKSKLNLDPGIYRQANKSLMPWQGDKSITIDRFDIRSTLSSIPASINKGSSRSSSVLDADESDTMKKLLNYERYRILIQNDINRTPQEVRLKLVAKSDIESDAKMRKLRNNRFGTSGEASLPITNNSNNSQLQSNFNNRYNSRKNTGPSYNSVPPPPSLMNPENRQSNIIIDQKQNDSLFEDKRVVNGESQGIITMNVIDLDEYDNLELDNIDHILRNFKDDEKIGDVTKKYTLTSDEFLYLAEKDSCDDSTNDLIKGLIKIIKESLKKVRMQDKKKDINIVYGPSLPPSLMNSNDKIHNKSECDEDDSSSDGSRVQQRSPSGCTIPLREDIKESNDDDDSLDIPLPPEKTIISSTKTNETESNSTIEMQEKPMANKFLPIRINLTGHSINIKTSDNEPKIEENSQIESKSIREQEIDNCTDRRTSRRDQSRRNEPRRASTPLAYKKYSRSERSISKERRSNRSSRKRHKHRSSHRSSSDSSTSSSSSRHR